MIRSPTSASNYFRRVLCRGSENMERDLPDSSSIDSRAGTKLHVLAADRTLDRSSLSEQERQTLEMAEAMDSEFTAWLISRADPAAEDRELQEYREITLTLFAGTVFEMKNHPDRVLLSGNIAAVSDYKFGRKGAPPASENYQLLIYLLSVWSRFAGKPGRKPSLYVGAMIQPWLSRQITPVEYTDAQMENAFWEVSRILEECKLEDAARTPGFDQCKLCKGRLHGTCPEVRNMALETIQPQTADAAIANPRRFLETMEAPNRTRLLDALEFVDDLREKIRGAAREMLADDPASVPQYKLGKPSEHRKVTDMVGLKDRLVARNIPEDAITAKCTISNSAIENLLREATKAKGKGLAELVDETLAGLVDVVPRAAPLKRVGHEEIDE